MCKSSYIQITQPLNLSSRSVTIEDQIYLIALLKLLPSGMAYRLQTTTAVAVLMTLLLPLRAFALATLTPTLEAECDTKAGHCGWELMEKQGMSFFPSISLPSSPLFVHLSIHCFIDVFRPPSPASIPSNPLPLNRNTHFNPGILVCTPNSRPLFVHTTT